MIEKKIERERSFIVWVILQMSALTGIGPGDSQSPEVSAGGPPERQESFQNVHQQEFAVSS